MELLALYFIGVLFSFITLYVISGDNPYIMDDPILVMVMGFSSWMGVFLMIILLLHELWEEF
jgi:hypothetical protein